MVTAYVFSVSLDVTQRSNTRYRCVSTTCYFRWKVRVMLKPVHTVAEKCDCRRIRRLSPLCRRFLRQSHFSATVWTGLHRLWRVCFFYRASKLAPTDWSPLCLSCRVVSPNSITTTCCQLLTDLLVTRQPSWHVEIVCRIANKSATSWQQVGNFSV